MLSCIQVQAKLWSDLCCTVLIVTLECHVVIENVDKNSIV